MEAMIAQGRERTRCLKGCGSRSRKDGGDVDTGLIDEALLKECAREDAATFKEDGVYAERRQFCERLNEGFPRVDKGAVTVCVGEKTQVAGERTVGT